MMNERLELNETMTEQVTGGTWGDNTYDDVVYNLVGIQVEHNIILKDEFTLPDGSKTDMEGADDYIAKRYIVVIRQETATLKGVLIYDKKTGKLIR